MKRILTSFLLLTALSLYGEGKPVPLFAAGGGYLDAGSHSGGLFQVEYRFGKYYLFHIRPQATLILPTLGSVFFGIGLGVELYMTKNLLFTPSFSPGLYYKGCGRDLGYPLEFRESIEMAYEWQNKARLGFQFYHISNASLSDRNPGANALTLFLAIPFCL